MSVFERHSTFISVQFIRRTQKLNKIKPSMNERLSVTNRQNQTMISKPEIVDQKPYFSLIIIAKNIISGNYAQLIRGLRGYFDFLSLYHLIFNRGDKLFSVRVANRYFLELSLSTNTDRFSVNHLCFADGNNE